MTVIWNKHILRLIIKDGETAIRFPSRLIVHYQMLFSDLLKNKPIFVILVKSSQ